MTSTAPDHKVVIVGAGFSGIGVAIRLDKAGISDFVILDSESGVGGAWHSNTYPGVVVDVPSFAYSFSFEQSSEWSSCYAKGAELKAYADMCVEKYGLRSRLRLNTAVAGAEFDGDNHLWRLSLADGSEITARFVVTATGLLTKPKTPDIPGIDDYRGTIVHTARWDHSVDLTGKRVAIIGTGASTVTVAPTIAPVVEHLTVFQRTPIWIMPKPDVPLDGAGRLALRHLPLLQTALRAASNVLGELSYTITTNFHRQLPMVPRGYARLGRAQLRLQVRDPEIRAKLTPTYGPGCKRVGFSNEYLPMFNRENVTLEASGIDTITETGIRAEDGSIHNFDVLILATGFKTFEAGNMPPFPIRGTDGTDLEQWWTENRYQAYHGVSVPGFPNLIVMNGPYSYNLTVYFQYIESQAKYIARLLGAAREKGATFVDVSREANDRYFANMLRRRRNQIYFSNVCAGSNSYFFDQNGDVPILAAATPEVQWTSTHFDTKEYVMKSFTPAAIGATR